MKAMRRTASAARLLYNIKKTPLRSCSTIPLRTLVGFYIIRVAFLGDVDSKNGQPDFYSMKVDELELEDDEEEFKEDFSIASYLNSEQLIRLVELKNSNVVLQKSNAIKAQLQNRNFNQWANRYRFLLRARRNKTAQWLNSVLLLLNSE